MVDSLEQDNNERSSSTRGQVKADSERAENDYVKLRQLLLGPDYDQAISNYINRDNELERVADVLAEAIKLCAKNDTELSQALAPVLNKAIHESITQNPTKITNAISPIMGPAIRKAVSAALLDMVQNLNKVLEQSFTARGITWRFKAWRSGVSYGRYVMSKTLRFGVEQVLLVHRETGLLLHSVVDDAAHAKDPELVSSMLTAIQDFVSDSFDTDGASSLDRVQIGDLTLHLLAGPYSVLAIAVRGVLSSEALSSIESVYESIQSRYATEMEQFEGDRDSFLSTEDDLRRCLLSEKITADEEEKKKPWLAIIVLLCIAVYAATSYYQSHVKDAEYRDIVQALEKQEGYVVLSHQRDDERVKVKLLRSHDALPTQAFSESLPQKYYSVDYDEREVTFGFIDQDKLNALSLPAKKPEPTVLESYLRLAGEIQSHNLFFEENAATLSHDSIQTLEALITQLKQLVKLAEVLKPGALQIMVLGFSDSRGSTYGNLTMSQDRAELIRSILIENGIATDAVVAWGLGHKQLKGDADKYQRRVSIQLLLPGVSEVKNEQRDNVQSVHSN